MPDLSGKTFIRYSPFSPEKTSNFAEFGTKLPNVYTFYVKFEKLQGCYLGTWKIFGKIFVRLPNCSFSYSVHNVMPAPEHSK